MKFEENQHCHSGALADRQYTKHGALKDQTDCAPNNGYYFLPLYDKGEYILKVIPYTNLSQPTDPVEKTNLNSQGHHGCPKGFLELNINPKIKGSLLKGEQRNYSSLSLIQHLSTLARPVVQHSTSPHSSLRLRLLLSSTTTYACPRSFLPQCELKLAHVSKYTYCCTHILALTQTFRCMSDLSSK
uniref:NOMO-like N-terminal beta-sandwich domain-containing protein n=1 Tax=Timema cristinae TaxID=61476 RepID=A0A7R9CZ01_TIMCR|nr:unnamed protein product [Timema cristinae]